MADRTRTTILVPIRYPLTDASLQTLAAAGRMAQADSPAELIVLHVNLLHRHEDVQTEEFTRAIASTLDDVDTAVRTRRGFVVEELILEEAIRTNAESVVVGASQKGRLQKFLGKLTGNDPEIGPFLTERLSDAVEVVEIDTADPKAPAA